MVLKEAGNFRCPRGGPSEELFVLYSSVTRAQLDQFESLIGKNSSEAELRAFLKNNPSVLVNSLKVLKTGYDGAWLIPRELIKSSTGAVENRHVPDFILGGSNSCCFGWYVMELKGADQQTLTESDGSLCFSSATNEALGKLVEQIDYCSSVHSVLRESLHLTDLMRPKGIIVVGRESEFSDDSRRQKFRTAWKVLMGSRIEITTYDAILRYVRSEVEFQENRL